MRIEPIRASLYPTPVQNVDAVNKVKNSNIIESYLDTMNKTTENEGVERRRFDSLESTDEKPDFKAIDLIKKSEIPPPEPPKLEDKVESAETLTARVNQTEGLPTDVSVQKRTEIQDDKADESATIQSSDEIEKKTAGNKLTPAQQKGVEAYQRVQNYINPLSVSNARVAS